MNTIIVTALLEIIDLRNTVTVVNFEGLNFIAWEVVKMTSCAYFNIKFSSLLCIRKCLNQQNLAAQENYLGSHVRRLEFLQLKVTAYQWLEAIS